MRNFNTYMIIEKEIKILFIKFLPIFESTIILICKKGAKVPDQENFSLTSIFSISAVGADHPSSTLIPADKSFIMTKHRFWKNLRFKIIFLFSYARKYDFSPKIPIRSIPVHDAASLMPKVKNVDTATKVTYRVLNYCLGPWIKNEWATGSKLTESEKCE